MTKNNRESEGYNSGKTGKNKLHKLSLGCDSDYDAAQLWINPSAPTHTHMHTANTTSVIVSDGLKSFQSAGDPVIPYRLGLRPNSRLRSN